MVLHSNRMEVLRDGLVEWLAKQPLAPLETEIITVQSNGIAQWLRSSLARSAPDGGPGIAAALDTPMPARLMWTLYRRVLGEQAVPQTSPLDEQPLVWRLMRLLGELPDNAVYRPLRQFLQDDDDLRKRFQLAERLADLFDQYQVYRADWLADWQAGNNVLRSYRQPRPLDDDQLWQAQLWRQILQDVGGEGAQAGRAAVHARFIEVLRQWSSTDGRPDLPRRIVVFGVSSLPRQSLEALIEVSVWTQVLVCVHNPCEYHWADIVEGRDLLRSVKRHHQPLRPGFPAELHDDDLHAHAHPLLASWGKQGRDYIAVLEELEEQSARAFTVGQAFSEVEGDSMLARLQDDIRALRPLAEIQSESRQVPTEDVSIQFHVAHSALREVEILHDRLLAAFDQDPTLQADDVIVMVPDIEQYAAYIEAVFGLYGPEDPRRIPYFIVDRGPGKVNTVADAVELLLSLPQARMGVSDLLDLLDIAAVRKRYELAEEDVAVLRQWVQGAQVRWGLDATHRQGLGLPIEPRLADIHTLAFGVRRMLLGYAMGDSEGWKGIAPHADVAGLDAGLVGKLAQLLERLQQHAKDLACPATPGEWAERLRRLLEDFLAAPDDLAAYTIEQLQQALDDWLQECEDSAFDQPLTLQVVRTRWMACLEKAGMAQRFTSGSVTFATLMPMRAIPFRHVCLLGMNDGEYPRRRTPAHFDLMEKDYRPGDRSRRDDDRYLFLEALLSARERFYVSWVGRSIVDNSEQPPSVLVGQLRDHLAAGWRAHDGSAEVLPQVTTEHPLQGFSGRYFEDASPDANLFTYVREWRSQAETEPVAQGAPDEPLDPLLRDEPLSFRELERFLDHPVREFFVQRLQVSYEENEGFDDHETFMATGLDNWSLNKVLIEAARKPLEIGADPWQACAAALERMHRSGELAFGGAAMVQMERGRDVLTPIFEKYSELLHEWPVPAAESLEIAYSCPGTPGLAGWLHGLRSKGGDECVNLILQATRLTDDRKRWRDEKMLEHWLQHLAANARGVPLTTVVVSPGGVAELLPLDTQEAAACLDDLLLGWMEGMRRPLPVKAEFARPVLLAIPEGMERVNDEENRQRLMSVDKVAAALRACATADWNRTDRKETRYELRAYPTAESLLAGDEMLKWVLTLYGPLFTALRTKEAE